MPKVAVYIGSNDKAKIGIIGGEYTTFKKNDVVIILEEIKSGTKMYSYNNPYFRNMKMKVSHANFSGEHTNFLCYSPSSNDLHWFNAIEVEVLTSNLSTRL